MPPPFKTAACCMLQHVLDEGRRQRLRVSLSVTLWLSVFPSRPCWQNQLHKILNVCLLNVCITGCCWTEAGGGSSAPAWVRLSGCLCSTSAEAICSKPNISNGSARSGGGAEMQRCQ